MVDASESTILSRTDLMRLLLESTWGIVEEDLVVIVSEIVTIMVEMSIGILTVIVLHVVGPIVTGTTMDGITEIGVTVEVLCQPEVAVVDTLPNTGDAGAIPEALPEVVVRDEADMMTYRLLASLLPTELIIDGEA